MKSLVPENLITITEDNVLIDGLLFPWQTQWNYVREDVIDRGSDTCLCDRYVPCYVVLVEEVEYFIPKEDAALAPMVNNSFLGQAVYKEKVASEWPDKADNDMLHLYENKVLEQANIVLDPKQR